MVGDHLVDQIIGSTTDVVRTKMFFQDKNMAMISQLEPKSINEAIGDDSWIEAMKEELSQFERNKVWNLIPNNQSLEQDGFSETSLIKKVRLSEIKQA